MPLVILMLLLSLGCASSNTEWTVERKNRADRANELGRAARAQAERGLSIAAPSFTLPTEPLLCDTAFIGSYAYTGCY